MCVGLMVSHIHSGWRDTGISDCTYPTPAGYRKLWDPTLGVGEAQLELPGPAQRPGPSGSQTLGYLGASGSRGRAENRIGASMG